MNAFERFLEVNELRKKDVAQFLGITATNITDYCKGGKIPKARLEALKSNKVWDTSMLVFEQKKPVVTPDTSLALITEQMNTLRELVESQKAEIVMLRELVKTVINEYKKD